MTNITEQELKDIEDRVLAVQDEIRREVRPLMKKASRLLVGAGILGVFGVAALAFAVAAKKAALGTVVGSALATTLIPWAPALFAVGFGFILAAFCVSLWSGSYNRQATAKTNGAKAKLDKILDDYRKLTGLPLAAQPA